MSKVVFILIVLILLPTTYGMEIIDETPEGGLEADFWIRHYAEEHDLPLWLVYAVIDHESGFNKTAVNHNTNGTSDYGYMQVNSQYIKSWYKQINPDKEYFEAFGNHDNIELGTHILSHAVSRGGTIDRALTIYNAGEGYLNKYGVRDVYVDKVLEDAEYWKKLIIKERQMEGEM